MIFVGMNGKDQFVVMGLVEGNPSVVLNLTADKAKELSLKLTAMVLVHFFKDGFTPEKFMQEVEDMG